MTTGIDHNTVKSKLTYVGGCGRLEELKIHLTAPMEECPNLAEEDAPV
jgi:hypothetical protein